MKANAGTKERARWFAVVRYVIDELGRNASAKKIPSICRLRRQRKALTTIEYTHIYVAHEKKPKREKIVEASVSDVLCVGWLDGSTDTTIK